MLEAKLAIKQLFCPKLVRIVQCHVDSYFLLLGRPTLEECVRDSIMFATEWPKWYSEKKYPGKFHPVRKSHLEENFSILMPSTSGLYITNGQGAEKPQRYLATDDRLPFILKYKNAKFKVCTVYDNNLIYLIPKTLI